MTTKTLLAAPVFSLIMASALPACVQANPGLTEQATDGKDPVQAFFDAGCADKEGTEGSECGRLGAQAKAQALIRLDSLKESPEALLKEYLKLARFLTEAERAPYEAMLAERMRQDEERRRGGSSTEGQGVPASAAAVNGLSEGLKGALAKPASLNGVFDGLRGVRGDVPFVALTAAPSAPAVPAWERRVSASGGNTFPMPPVFGLEPPVPAGPAPDALGRALDANLKSLDAYAAKFPFRGEPVPARTLPSPGEAALSALKGVFGIPSGPQAKLSQETVRDVTGAARKGTLAVFPDGRTAFTALAGGMSIRTAPDGSRIHEDLLRGEYLEEVEGRRTVAWSRDPKTGWTRGTFHGVDFTAGPGEEPMFLGGKDKLYIVKGKNAKGEPNVVRLVGTDGVSAVLHREGLAGADSLIIQGSDGKRHNLAYVDPSRELPWPSLERLEPEKTRYLRAFLSDLPGLFPSARAALVLGEVRGGEIRDGQLRFVLNTGNDGDYKPLQVVADTVGEGGQRHTRAFLIGLKERYMLDFSPDGKTVTMRRRDEELSAKTGRNEYEDYRVFQRDGSNWKGGPRSERELKNPTGLSVAGELAYDSAASAGGMALNVVGTGGKVIFAVPQTAVSFLLAAGFKMAAGGVGLAAPEGFGAAYLEFQKEYTWRQSILVDAANAMADRSLGTSEGRKEAYEASMKGIDSRVRGQMEAYLDSRIREEDPEAMLLSGDSLVARRHQMAAEAFGGMNIPKENFRIGQQYLSRGGAANVAKGIAFDLAGMAHAGGTMFLEGGIFSKMTAPLKLLGLQKAGLLTAEEVAASARVGEALRAGRASSVALADAQAFAKTARLLETGGRYEMGLLSTPLLASSVENAYVALQGAVSGDRRKAWEGVNGLLGDVPGIVGLGLGLRAGGKGGPSNNVPPTAGLLDSFRRVAADFLGPRRTSASNSVLEVSGRERPSARPLLVPQETVRDVPLSEVRPTQMDVGKAQCEEMLGRLRQEAVDFRKGKPEYEHLSDEAALAKYLREQVIGADVPVGAFIGPDGKTYVTDGHHRTVAISLALQGELKALPSALQPGLKVKVLGDYTGRPQAEFAKALREAGAGNFTPELEARTRVRVEELRKQGAADPQGQALAELYANLPENFAAIENNPMRAAVGEALKANGIKSTQYVDYIEFRVGEWLEARGVTVKSIAAELGVVGPRPEVDPRVVRRVRQELLKAEAYKEMLGSPATVKAGKEPFAKRFFELSGELFKVEDYFRQKGIPEEALARFRNSGDPAKLEPEVQKLQGRAPPAEAAELGRAFEKWTKVAAEANSLGGAAKDIPNLAGKLQGEYKDAFADARAQMLELFPEAEFGAQSARPKGASSVEAKLAKAHLKGVDNGGAGVTDAAKARAAIDDAIGTRVTLKDASPRAVDALVDRLVGAIERGELEVSKINNYRSKNDGLPYATEAQVARIREAMARRGRGEVEVASGDRVLKESGYTSLQMGVRYANGATGELQVRGRQVDVLAEIEHINYDLKTGKGLNPSLQNVPGLAAVAETIRDFTPEQHGQFNDYIAASYRRARLVEQGGEAAGGPEVRLPASLAAHPELAIDAIAAHLPGHAAPKPTPVAPAASVPSRLGGFLKGWKLWGQAAPETVNAAKPVEAPWLGKRLAVVDELTVPGADAQGRPLPRFLRQQERMPSGIPERLGKNPE